MRRHQDDAGGIITGWLMQMLVFMAVVGVLVYEIGSIGVTAVGLDDISRDVARAAALNYRETRNLAKATAAAQERAEEFEVQIVVGPEVDDGDVVVTVSEQAPTLLVHRVGFLEDFSRPSVTGRAPWEQR